MSDFLNIREKIEANRLAQERALEEQNSSIMEQIQQSQQSLRKYYSTAEKRFQNDIKKHENELSIATENYLSKALQSLEKANREKEVQSNYRLIKNLLVTIMLLLIGLIAVNYLKANQTKSTGWEIPKRYQLQQENGQRFIVIPKSDLTVTKDGKKVYLQLKKGA